MGKATFQMPIGTELTGVNKPTSIRVSRRVWGVDDWSVKLPYVDSNFTGLTQGLVMRDGAELIRGRCLKPRKVWGGGSTMELPGLGYAAEANRFITGQGTISSLSVSDGIQQMLDGSPSSHGITLGTVDTFYPIKQPNLVELDSTLEFLGFTYSNCGISYDISGTPEVANGSPDGSTTNCLPYGWLRCCFMDKRGRMFVFWSDASNNVKYSSSTNGGTTWAAAVDTTYNSNSARIDVTYDTIADHVHLGVYTGAATAFYTGSISGGTITFSAGDASVFNANNYMRCSFMDENSSAHIFVIGSGNHLWESLDDGATFTDRGALTDTGKLVYPTNGSSDKDDMVIIEYDVANADLELYKWDASAGAEVYVSRIKDFTAIGRTLGYLAGTISHDGKVHLTGNDNGNNVYYWTIDTDFTVTEVAVAAAVSSLYKDRLTIWCDNARGCYVGYNYPGGTVYKKYIAGVYNSVSTCQLGASEYNIQSPIRSRVGSENIAGFTISGGITAGAQRVDTYLFPPYGIGLSSGETTGTFHSSSIVADGDFERWGILSATQIVGDDVTYDVETAGGVDIVTGLKLDADLYSSGVPNTDTTIVLEVTLAKTGVNYPYVQAIYVNERWTKIDGVTYDFESIGAWLDKVKRQVGGEWDLDSSNVLTFVDELGSDHSATVTLQEGVNCKSITVDDLFDSYANVVVVTDNSSITQTIRNTSEIDANGEFWYVIRDPEMSSDGLAWNRGSVAVAILSQGAKVINVDFMDDQSGRTIAGILDRGDTVRVVNPKTGTTQSARIVEITRQFDSKGESVSAQLVNSGRAKGVIDFWAEIEDIRRNM